MASHRILLVNQLQFGDRFLPLGLLKVANALERAAAAAGESVSVRILDTSDVLRSPEHFAAFREHLAGLALDASLVGFTDFTFYGLGALRAVVERLRADAPSLPIVLGGFGPTLDPARYEAALSPDVLFVGVLGEAMVSLGEALPHLLRWRADPDAAKRALRRVPGLRVDGVLTGPPPSPLRHDAVSWDLERYGLRLSDYLAPAQGAWHFVYRVSGTTRPPERELILPYQFERISCPNHARQAGCTFCAMATQLEAARERGTELDLAGLDPAAVTAELSALRPLLQDVALHVFATDDALTAASLRRIRAAFDGAGLTEHLRCLSAFVRPDSINASFVRELRPLTEAGTRAQLFVGFDFFTPRFHELARTRKKVETYPAVMERLASLPGVDVIAAVILTHPDMRADDLEQHLGAVVDFAFRWPFQLSLAPFIFAAIDDGDACTPVTYRGYYQSNTLRDVLGEEPRPMIRPFAAPPSELTRCLELIDDTLVRLGREREVLATGRIHATNWRKLVQFLHIARDHLRERCPAYRCPDEAAIPQPEPPPS